MSVSVVDNIYLCFSGMPSIIRILFQRFPLCRMSASPEMQGYVIANNALIQSSFKFLPVF